jgi:hypothetical protein
VDPNDPLPAFESKETRDPTNVARTPLVGGLLEYFRQCWTSTSFRRRINAQLLARGKGTDDTFPVAEASEQLARMVQESGNWDAPYFRRRDPMRTLLLSSADGLEVLVFKERLSRFLQQSLTSSELESILDMSFGEFVQWVEHRK